MSSETANIVAQLQPSLRDWFVFRNGSQDYRPGLLSGVPSGTKIREWRFLTQTLKTAPFKAVVSSRVFRSL